MKEMCSKVPALTSHGGAVDFRQRETNTERVLQCLRESVGHFHIAWKKKTSAVPSIRNMWDSGEELIAVLLRNAANTEANVLFHRAGVVQ
jgi:hypothetical protein